MVAWWNSLSTLGQVFATIAIPATVVLVFQTIMLMFSFGGGEGTGGEGYACDHGDVDGGHLDPGDVGDTSHGDVAYDGGLRIFTIRGIISFFTIFGWSGLVFLRYGMSPALSIVIAFILGVLSMMLMAYAFAAFLRLQSNGATDIKWAVGASGTVYLTIPSNRKGSGKINVMAGGKYCEFPAVTDDEQPIPTSESVVVTGVTGETTLVVMRR